MVRPTSRVSRVLMTGPLAPFAEAYALELRQRGYTPLTSVNQLRQVARLSRWLEVRGLGVAELTGERVEEFLALQRAGGRYRAQWSRPGLLCLLECAATAGGGGGRGTGGWLADRCAVGVVRAVPASERGLAAGTIVAMCRTRAVPGRVASRGLAASRRRT